MYLPFSFDVHEPDGLSSIIFVCIYSYDKRRTFDDVHSWVNRAWFIYWLLHSDVFYDVEQSLPRKLSVDGTSSALVAVCIYLPFIHPKVNILNHVNMKLLNRKKRKKNSFFVCVCVWLYLCDWHKCWWSSQIMSPMHN